MSNEYYDHTTFPTPGSPGSSAALRAELDLIEVGFNKLPILTGNGGKFVAVNSAGTALEASTALQFSGSALVVIPSSITWSGNPTHSGNHTWSGYHVLNAGTANQVQYLDGSKQLTGSADFLYDGSYLTATFKDTTLTLKNATDVTKAAAFDLSGITPGQTRSYSLPNVSGALATLGNIAQTFAGNVTVSGTLASTNSVSFDGASINLGTGVSNTTIVLGSGATNSGATKNISIGTNGASGSTTNITLGSATAGSTTSVNIYSNGVLVAQATGGIFSAASLALTGTPTAPTAAPGTNTTQVATTAFVTAAAFNTALPDQTGNAGKYVTTDGTTASWSAVQGASFNEFTSSGTWTKPSGATFVMVEAWGAGGGGASGRRGAAASARSGGDGGGGGAYTQRLFRASDLGATETVTIGAGGAGSAARTTDNTDGTPGTAGGNTSFGSLLIAYGGAGGPTGGAGGTSSGAARGGGALSAGIDQSSGGEPASNANAAGGFGAGQGTSTLGVAGAPSGWGGGNGGGSNTSNLGLAGGCSFQGGPGGGAGGGISTSNLPTLPGVGGFNVGANGNGPFGILTTTSRVGGGGGIVNEISSANLYGAGFGGGVFATTGTGQGGIPTVLTSTDSVTWTVRQTPVSNTTGVTPYGNGTWVVWNSSQAYRTTDFIGYVKLELPISSGIQIISYVNSNWVVLSSTGSYATSTDLVNWTLRNSGTANLRDITWTGTNYVVAASGAIIYSTDLISWSTATGWAGVARGIAAGTSGRVAVVNNASTVAYYSTNHGQTWTAATTAPTNGATNNSLTFGGGTFVFANQSSEVWTSTDGNTWTQQTDGTTDGYGGVAYSGTTWFVSSSTNNTNAGITSTNLTAWTTRTFSALSAAGGTGGDGGASWGGGGGGGGASLNGNNSGAGGAGAAGRVRVYTW